MRLICASTWLVFTAAGLYLLGPAAPFAAPQEKSEARLPTLSKRARAIKPTWHSGPATTPPQTEIVPLPREAPPPAKSLLLGVPAEGKKPDIAKPGAGTLADSGSNTVQPVATFQEPAPTLNATQRDSSGAPLPEPQRIRNELDHLRNDTGARHAFYDELRRTVEQVRSGRRDEVSQNPRSVGLN
jgi:hypothetical protein